MLRRVDLHFWFPQVVSPFVTSIFHKRICTRLCQDVALWTSNERSNSLARLIKHQEKQEKIRKRTVQKQKQKRKREASNVNNSSLKCKTEFSQIINKYLQQQKMAMILSRYSRESMKHVGCLYVLLRQRQQHWGKCWMNFKQFSTRKTEAPSHL